MLAAVAGLVRRIGGAALLLSAALALHDRLGADARVGLESGHDFLLDLALDQALDVAQQTEFVHAYQRNGFAARTGATSAADAVHVIVSHVGQLEIDHMRQFVDVEAAPVRAAKPSRWYAWT